MPVTAQSRGYSVGVDAGADADLEHAIAGLDAHPLNRLEAAGVERRAEREVVDRRELFVDAATKSFSTAVTDNARVAASDPMISSSSGVRRLE